MREAFARKLVSTLMPFLNHLAKPIPEGMKQGGLCVTIRGKSGMVILISVPSPDVFPILGDHRPIILEVNPVGQFGMS